MSDIRKQVSDWVRAAAVTALGEAGNVDPLVRAAKDARFGDYQANLAMSLGKQLGRKPRDLADEIVRALSESHPGAFERADVAGPGFINLKLSAVTIDEWVRKVCRDARLGADPASTPQTVVVDYSSPNLAKEMHIGHLRSTIIGDAICRVLAFHGDTVIRHNHLGDWGTQFGMLLEHLIDTGWDPAAGHGIRDLNELYQNAKKRFDADVDFAERSRKRVVALQAGQAQSLALWRQLIDESVAHMTSVYAKLGVLLQTEDIRPESFYNPKLPAVVEDLRAAGLLTSDQGAGVVFPDGYTNKEGEPLPMIVQKSDGGYGYATTDLAAVRFRVGELGATRIIYVVDARQSDHFGMLFWALRAAGWAPEGAVSLEHVKFGTILGKNKKPFATRDGGTVRLVDVLDEAVERATAVIAEKNPDLDAETKARVARAVGIGGVKYADLSNERIKDYVFDWDRMLALEGNTAPYSQYVYARVQSIFRKGGVTREDLDAKLDVAHLHVVEPTERTLAMLLLQLPSVVEGVATSLEPHRLCSYLYEVAAAFHAFNFACRVLNAPSDEVRTSRLLLCDVTARTVKLGLGLLGIECVEQM